ncbi:MAG: hypothetical protein WAM91_02985 [Candidatus Acidiferrales bacterium]
MGSARGGSRLRVVIVTALLVAFAYTSYKIIPPYFANYQLEDDIHQEALFSIGKFNDDTIRDHVFREMQAHGIDATKDSIHIQQNDARGLKLSVDYTTTVDLLVYTLHLRFTPSSNNQSLVQ